jgi:peptidoglycan/LPS O-acetylase OafA/YrhL
MSVKYYKELDGLRGLAALTIFFFHFLHGREWEGLLPRIVMKFVSFGPTMANMFFVLSGFLITQILISAKGTDNYFSRYYAKRILRIFPLYYLALLIYFFGLPLLHSRPLPSWNMQWYNWVHLQNLPLTFKWPHAGPKYLWSLAVEEHFYLLWPMLVFWCNKRQMIICSCIFFIGALISRVVLTENNYPAFYFTLSTLDALSIGAIAGILNYHKDLPKYQKHLKIIVLATGIPVVLLWILFFGTKNNVFHTLMPVIINIFYAAALCLIVQSGDGNPIKRLLKTRTLIFAGTISYGFFIFHPLCISFTQRLLHHHAISLQLFVSLIFSVIAATISYFFYERWFMKLKRKFT